MRAALANAWAEDARRRAELVRRGYALARARQTEDSVRPAHLAAQRAIWAGLTGSRGDYA